MPKAIICLHREDADELHEAIRELMDQYHHNDYGPDNNCAFCGEEPQSGSYNIHHASDCIGEKFLKLLDTDA